MGREEGTRAREAANPLTSDGYGAACPEEGAAEPAHASGLGDPCADNEAGQVEKMQVREVSTALDADQPDESDLLVFQAKLWELLDRRVTLYTSGESSSVPQLTAHRLLASALYVLDIDPEDVDAETLHRLARADLGTEFEQGLETIREKTQQCSKLWQQVALSTPLLESTALKDTLTSIDAFLKSYDCRFFAAEIEADIDYPPCFPVPETLQGIDYIHEYLSRLQIENRFMNCFELSQEKALLRRVSPEYRELIVNLFEPIATNAIGRVLAGEDVRRLDVSEDDRARIAAMCNGLSAIEYRRCLSDAAEAVCSNLRITENNEREYMRKVAQTLIPRIKAFSNNAGLAGVFLSFRSWS